MIIIVFFTMNLGIGEILGEDHEKNTSLSLPVVAFFAVKYPSKGIIACFSEDQFKGLMRLYAEHVEF
ncbi:MAG: hypothetical protein QG610_434 [Euryarchaeota archaeon]|nr:hypothetical protein [Euryarchaeota archaeon]